LGKLITVVGNSGVGKTTFTRQLSQRLSMAYALEQHVERPFQAAFAQDLRSLALPNQVDYLLFRAEQELDIRRQAVPGIQDGGLDEDFQVFTRLFLRKGYLSEPEFRLCERLYALARQLLPPPDLVIHLTAPLDVIRERFSRRNRFLEIAQPPDLPELEALLQDWLAGLESHRLLSVDVSKEDPDYQEILPPLVPQIEASLNASPQGDQAIW
jgi:deoxyadenosine/deoxycytidine kinase